MQRDSAMGSQALLSSLMSSPGAESLDLPISTSELERLAKSVQGWLTYCWTISDCTTGAYNYNKIFHLLDYA